MGQTEFQIFIVLATLILMVFISGILLFIAQYRRKKLMHEKEKTIISEQHRQDLLHTRLEIQSQTMQDIGREIHDNVGQRLTLAAIYANQLASDRQYPAISERITEVGKIIDESLADLRNLSRNLSNAQVDGPELKEMIDSECRRVTALQVCQVFAVFNHTRYQVSATIKNFLLRIIQEFMQNSLKHSGCENINLSFHHTDEGLRISAADDGRGFDIDEVKGKGIGLINMEKRAELIGATSSLTSRHQNGTILQLFIPADKLNA